MARKKSRKESRKEKKKSRKVKKPKKKVAWYEEDEVHRQALIDSAEKYAKARQDLLSIPGTSVLGDIQYAMSLLIDQHRAEAWPDMFEAKYDLSLAESPVKEGLDAARAMEEHSNLTAVLHQQLNYDFDWALNESSRILSNAIGEPYDDWLEVFEKLLAFDEDSTSSYCSDFDNNDIHDHTLNLVLIFHLLTL
ncbi:hypothetical protein C1645_807004 [Glomus cerebriforme]|uniref:Uncharacterized protein n=1 Tax=Glomus cerebriforme TaxID=658196 RepID=A0A397SVM6_9GLOM|nr:hypothetical protein C1645_807004 [Glomus cerebriforme]